MKVVLVAFGGALGASLRYLFGMLGKNWSIFNIPLATTIVNLLGCFLIGILSVLFLKDISENNKLLWITGVCGGFTTFSTFALEQKNLLEQGFLGSALFHLALNNILGIIFVILGYYIASKLWV